MHQNEYHSIPRASSTVLKHLMAETPAHVHARYFDPEREQIEPTPAMKFGSAWHKVLFELDTFLDEYVVIPEGIDHRTKDGKALFAEIEASGKIALSFSDNTIIDKMHQAALSKRVVKHILDLPGEAERSFFWTDERTGVECKARMDWIVYPCEEFPLGLVADGKTCQSASIEGFGKSVWDMGYCLQAAFYVDAFQREFKTAEPPPFVWIAQEKTVPYLTAVRRARQDHIQYGREQYEAGLDIMAECLKTGVWLGYSEDIEDQELPPWAQKQIDFAYADDEETIEVLNLKE